MVGIHSGQITEHTKKINDHSTNLEDIDKQITQLMAADEKISKDLTEVGKQMLVNSDKAVVANTNQHNGIQLDVKEEINKLQSTMKTVADDISIIQLEQQRLTTKAAGTDEKMKTLVAEMTSVSSENKATAKVAGNLANKV